jgi:hypothetical protein
MSAMLASAPHRARVLRALGLVAWQRRTAVEHTPAAAPATAAPTQSLPASAGVVVVLPPGCAVRELDLLGRALSACGAQLARAPRIEATGDTMQVPHAPAYLVFGQAQAHALGRALPAQVMRDAHIVLADAPAEILAHASAKRRLWQALRSLRRALAAVGR